jgi:phenylalanyl-tRNA synthetase beta chain
VLRGVTFSRASYDSFIDLQDKLHNNICRKRALVAIGTHDLSTLSPPFTYACVPPAELSFVPLSQARPFRGDELLEFYRTEPSVKHIKPYLGLLGPAPAALAPLITDAAGTVLSLPPLINGEQTKITLATRDVFIECTATDLSKAHTVLNTMVTMFCEYAAEPFTVEQVRVTYAQPVTAFLGGVGGAASQLVAEQATPDLSSRHATASPAAIASLIGAPVLAADAAALLSKMGLAARAVEGAELAGAAAAAAASGLTATPLSSGDPERTLIAVTVPPTRSDVLQECDIAEDVAIAFGYNNIVRTLPATPTSGGQLPVNALTDKLRAELAAAGAQECLTLALVSREENYGAMLLKEDGRAVVLANPQRCEKGPAR